MSTPENQTKVRRFAEVKNWSPHTGHTSVYIEEKADGDYVLFSDYEALGKQLEAFKAGRDSLGFPLSKQVFPAKERTGPLVMGPVGYDPSTGQADTQVNLVELEDQTESRLRKEIINLRTKLAALEAEDQACRKILQIEPALKVSDYLTDAIPQIMDTIKALKAEVQKLRKALDELDGEMHGDCCCIDMPTGVTCRYCAARKKARAALNSNAGEKEGK